MAAGYSGTPLAKKLGIKPGMVVAAVGAPANYKALLAPLPRGVTITARPAREPQFIHAFVKTRADLARRLAAYRSTLAQAGTVWISWPKQASGVRTDVTENVIREVALPLGFVDVKVCAVDETWSGVKLVIRVSERR